MPDGPVEYLVIEFPSNEFHADLVAALNDLVASGTVRILDLVLVAKDGEGNVEALEIDDLDDEVRALFTDLDGEYDGLFGQDDILLAAEALDPGHLAAVMVFENSWAARFVGAMRAAGGVVVANERIPADVIDEALAALATEEASR
jgi:hypothetical protein